MHQITFLDPLIFVAGERLEWLEPFITSTADDEFAISSLI